MRFRSVALAGITSLLSVSAASAAFINNISLLDANTVVSWGQLGNPGSSAPPVFTASSSNGVSLQGTFLSGSSGTVAKVCPSTNCNWAGAPSFNPADFLVWTEDANGNGSGPLAITFTSPVRGVGFYVELTAPGTFVVNFAVIAGANTTTEMVASDSAGDPLFVGALDPAADVHAIVVTPTSCAPLSPGGCNPTDFAIDSLFVAAPVPEPSTLLTACAGLALLAFWRRLRWAPSRAGLIAVCAFAPLSSVPARAQDPIAMDAGDAPVVDPIRTTTTALDIGTASGALGLPTWRYQVTSPVNGSSYSGYMIGGSPFNRGARTTTIPVVLIPFIVQFTNTTSGFTTTFDPTAAPDAGCTAGETAMGLIASSPMFQSREWTLNGTDVGNTQYIDAFQRANFWQYVQNTGDAYHVFLTYTAGDPLALSLTYSAPTLTAEVRTGVPGPCTNPAGSGAVNAGAYQGIMDFNVMRNAMTGYIASHGITPAQLPIFILYNVGYSQNGGLYLGGYHFSEAPYPQALVSPGQTFIVANFRTNGTGPFDVSILSHEVAEWMDDPGGYSAVPAWGNIGEVTGCRGDLEVGDPLTLTDLPPIAGANGFNYHLQELAFFSWFFRNRSIGAGAIFSDGGSLANDAGPVCQ